MIQNILSYLIVLDSTILLVALIGAIVLARQ